MHLIELTSITSKVVPNYEADIIILRLAKVRFIYIKLQPKFYLVCETESKYLVLSLSASENYKSTPPEARK